MEKNVSKFDESFVKNYGEDSSKGYILEVDIDYSKKNYLICIVIYHIYQKKRKLKNLMSLFVI